MDRRRFSASALAAVLGGTGFGVIALSPRAALAQRRGISPIASVSVRGAQFEATIYQGGNASEAFLMTRSGGREQWQLITIPPGAQRAAQVMLNERGVTLTLGEGTASRDLQAEFRMRGADLQFSVSDGNNRYDGVASAAPGAGPSDQFLGILITVIIATLVPYLVFGVAIVTGEYIRSRSRCRGVDCAMEFPPARNVPSPIR